MGNAVTDFREKRIYASWNFCFSVYVFARCFMRPPGNLSMLLLPNLPKSNPFHPQINYKFQITNTNQNFSLVFTVLTLKGYGQGYDARFGYRLSATRHKALADRRLLLPLPFCDDVSRVATTSLTRYGLRHR